MKNGESFRRKSIRREQMTCERQPLSELDYDTPYGRFAHASVHRALPRNRWTSTGYTVLQNFQKKTVSRPRFRPACAQRVVVLFPESQSPRKEGV